MKIPSQPLDIFVSWSKYLLTFWEHLIVESFFQRVKNCLAFQNGRQTSNERKSAVHFQIWSFTYIAGYLSCRITDIEGFLTIYGHSDNLLNNNRWYSARLSRIIVKYPSFFQLPARDLPGIYEYPSFFKLQARDITWIINIPSFMKQPSFSGGGRRGNARAENWRGLYPSLSQTGLAAWQRPGRFILKSSLL